MTDPTGPQPRPPSDPGADRPLTSDDRTFTSHSGSLPSQTTLRPGDSGYDAATSPTSPVVPRRRGNGIRWAVALGATALVVAAGLGLFMVLGRGGGGSAAGAASYLPAGTVAYGELRLDLPGDQRQKLGQFLAHFPGFADQAALEPKIDETFDRALKGSTNAELSYTGDVKPWFTGQVSMSLLSVPDMSAKTEGAEGKNEVPRLLVAIGVSDQQKAQAEVDKLKSRAEKEGASFTSEDYAGTKIWSLTPKGGANAGSDARVAHALTADTLLIAARPEDIRAALDQKGGANGAGPRLVDSESFKKAVGRLRTDRLATFVMNLVPFREQLVKQASGQGQCQDASIGEELNKLPDQLMGALHAESDRMVMESRFPIKQGMEVPAIRDSGLAARVPGNNLFYIETREAGKTISRTVTQLKKLAQCQGSDAQAEQQVKQIEGILGTKLESFLDFLDDVAITGRMEGDLPTGGMVATVTDETIARERVSRLASLVTLAGAQSGGGESIKTSEEDYKGAKISIIALSSGSGGPTIEVAYTVHQKLFVLGLGREFVKSVLDGGNGQGLASQQRFQDALKSLGGPNTGGVFWVDLAAIRGQIETRLEGSMRSTYEKEYQPYLSRFDQFVAVSLKDADDLVSRAVLIVK